MLAGDIARATDESVVSVVKQHNDYIVVIKNNQGTSGES